MSKILQGIIITIIIGGALSAILLWNITSSIKEVKAVEELALTKAKEDLKVFKEIGYTPAEAYYQESPYWIYWKPYEAAKKEKGMRYIEIFMRGPRGWQFNVHCKVKMPEKEVTWSNLTKAMIIALESEKIRPELEKAKRRELIVSSIRSTYKTESIYEAVFDFSNREIYQFTAGVNIMTREASIFSELHKVSGPTPPAQIYPIPYRD